MIVVAGSSPDNSTLETTEAIDLQDKYSKCDNLADIPHELYESTGGIIGDVAIICGGTYKFNSSSNISSNQCYKTYGNKGWTKIGQMMERSCQRCHY